MRRRKWIITLLWARKYLILAGTVASLLGGVGVIIVAPPRYLATARVTLDYLKPDPITGARQSNKTVDEYIISQARMVRDVQVTVPAAEAMGWLDNPDFADAYANRPPNDRTEYPLWIAQRYMAGAGASLVADSNILQIEFRGATPELSLAVVEALRQSYIEANIETRRQTASGRADDLFKRSEVLKKRVAALEKIKLDYERASGVSLAAGENDPDSLLLRRLATGGDGVVLDPGPARMSDAERDLQELEQMLTEATATLGPNHPQLGLMRQRRDLLRSQVALRQSKGSALEQAMREEGRQRSLRLENQKQKILSNREKMLQLRLHQDEINRERGLLTTALQQLAGLRQLGNSTTGNVTAIGDPAVNEVAVFPNIPLVLFGTGGLGLTFSVLLALLFELLNRRVRCLRDLELAAEKPIFGVVPASRMPRRARPPGKPPKTRRKLAKTLKPQTA